MIASVLEYDSRLSEWTTATTGFAYGTYDTGNNSGTFCIAKPSGQQKGALFTTVRRLLQVRILPTIRRDAGTIVRVIFQPRWKRGRWRSNARERA